MEQMGGMDAAFLAMETPSMHMHVAAVMVFSPEEGMPGGREGFERVRSVLSERLHLVAPFRRRAVMVPLGLHHPVWIEDPAFDLDYHLRRASLPAPGGPAELVAFVGDLIGRPLDTDRPLWEMHVVEGLEHGRVAVVTKVHHAAIDGVSGASLLAAFMDLEPDPPPMEPPARAWRPEAVPSAAEMVVHALAALAREPEAAAGVLRRGLDAATRLRAWGLDLAEEGISQRPPAPFSAPRTSLNGSISPHRRVAVAEVGLGSVLETKRAFSCSVNDVVLAAVGGALGELLVERGQEPERPLVALVPVSNRRGREQGGSANQVSGMLVALDACERDPAARLRAAAAAAKLAKAQARMVPPELVDGLAEVAFPALAARAARLVGNLGLFDHLRPPCNVVVSNVRGPEVPLWCAGSRLEAVYPVGPVVEGVGLNVTVMSYLDRLHMGIVGCRELVPDVDRLATHVTDAFKELAKAAGREL